MGQTKKKLSTGQTAFGAWMLMAHPSIAEIYAGEGFDWVAVDLEHTTIDLDTFYHIALALKGTGCDVLARLHSCDPVQAKGVLDAGADGIIVPSVNTAEQARQAVAMAKYPPLGNRGASLSRATDFGRSFQSYYAAHNENVLVAVMLEHVTAVENADEILAIPGVDAAFIGPYDLSASMGKPGCLDDPEVANAQTKILEACGRHGVAPGIHVVAVDADQLRSRQDEGYRLIACGLDTTFIMFGCRQMLKKANRNA